MPRFTGQSIERVEDPRFLTGADRFVSAVARPGMLHLAFVRSPHAHARILDVDVSAACAVPGVVAVLTATELDPFVSPQVVAGPPGLKTPQVRPLASDKVRYVGDPVALVVAETAALAADGRDLVVVDYEPLRAVVRMDDALDPASPPLFDDLGDNLVFHDTSVWGPVDEVFARADLVVSRQFTQHRISHAPLEGRGGVASYESVTGRLEYEIADKRPHSLRLAMSTLLGIPYGDIHVVARDIGGAFGSKGQVTREDVALCAAAKLLGATVKWVEERSENLLAAGHAGDETLDVEAAVTRDGRVLGFRVRMVSTRARTRCRRSRARCSRYSCGRCSRPRTSSRRTRSRRRSSPPTRRATSRTVARGSPRRGSAPGCSTRSRRELGLPPEELRFCNLVGNSNSTDQHATCRR